MARYAPIDGKPIKTSDQIARLMEDLFLAEFGAKTEVTLASGRLMIYTEALNAAKQIKALASKSAKFLRASEYEAEDEMPAATTLVFEF